MVVKPTALVVVSVLVAAAAGTGEYLAVRDNRDHAEAGVPEMAVAVPALSGQDTASQDANGLGVVDATNR